MDFSSGPLAIARSQVREGFFKLVKFVSKRSQHCSVSPVSECGTLRTPLKVDCAADVLTGRFQLRPQFVVLGIHDLNVGAHAAYSSVGRANPLRWYSFAGLPTNSFGTCS